MPRAVAKIGIRILFGSSFAIGPGKADLLQAVEDTGSISAAARSMGMSYRRAWLLIDTMNRCFREPVVDTAAGGAGGGGARITVFGKKLLGIYRKMEAEAKVPVIRQMAGFSRLLRKSPPSGKTY